MQSPLCHFPAVTSPQHSHAVGDTKCPPGDPTHRSCPTPAPPAQDSVKYEKDPAMQGRSQRRLHCSTHSQTSSQKAPSSAGGQSPAPFPTSLGFWEVYVGSCGCEGSTAGSNSLFPSSWDLAGPVPELAELRPCKDTNLLPCRILPRHRCILQCPALLLG